ncbi:MULTISPECIES: hypothetical protein [unclassified Paenibacillus]|uniref:hypothetical protein n=1 Tax=unclassified Paenibacillus TaxID=185978 RepID=UPI000A52A325|nr:hypothetical protein [Paenibacillus sp. FSL P4-0081]
MNYIKEFLSKAKQNEKYLFLWDITYIGIIGMNSFIILFHHNWNKDMDLGYTDPLTKVIGAATLSYLLTFIFQVMILRKKNIYAARRTMLYTTRKVFRLIYMTVCLVIIMIKQINMGIFDSVPVPQSAVFQSATMFMGTLIIGTSCLWSGKLWRLIKYSSVLLSQLYQKIEGFRIEYKTKQK